MSFYQKFKKNYWKRKVFNQKNDFDLRLLQQKKVPLILVVSQFRKVIFLDLYSNLKFLSNPNIFAFSKYLLNAAIEAPFQAPISNKSNFSFLNSLKYFS